MKTRGKLALVAVVILGLMILLPLVSRRRASTALLTYRAQLVARGEKLTIAENAPKGTDAERRAAQDLMSAIGSLSSSPRDYPPLMKSLAPGHVLVASAEEVLPTEESSNVWPRMIREVSNHEEEFAKVRAALTNSAFDFNLNYKQGPLLLLPHLIQIKASATWFAVAALVKLHEHKNTEALESLKACLALAKTLEHEKVEISQLVRIAISAIGLSATWEVLQYSQWQDAQLADLQKTWEDFNFLPGAQAAFEMERAWLPGLFDYGRADFTYVDTTPITSLSAPPPSVSFMGILNDPKEAYERFMNRYPKYWAWKSHWSYEEELFDLKSLDAGLDSLRTLASHSAFAITLKTLEKNIASINNSYSNIGEHFRLALAWPVVPSYVLKFADTEMERRIVIAAIALKRYQIRTGKYPATLNDLVPEYLREVPLDVMDGKPLRYRANDDGTFLLYSVGEDGVDDGGDPNPSPATSTLKSWWKARDAVWPMPAGTNEVQIHKRKMTAEWSAKQALENGKRLGRRMPAPSPEN